MVIEQKVIANQVVESFQDLLGNDVKDAIGEHNFNALNSMVCEAIDAHSETIIELLENVLKQIRADVEKRPIEL